ncbi:sodium-dependent multivitamin transporter-like [Amblyomma americanum]
MRGVFLAGVVGASMSTVSSIINSHSAVFYVDVVTPYFSKAKKRPSYVISIIAIASGVMMTGFATLLPYMGTAARVTMVICNSISGPLCGLFLLALLFPWSNTKGAASSTLVSLALLLWHSVGRSFSGIEPPRMDVSIDGCLANVTAVSTSALRHVRLDVFPFYRISANWMSVFSVLFTIATGLVVSLATGGRREVDKSLQLSSKQVLCVWAQVGLLSRKTLVSDGSPEMSTSKEAISLIPRSGEEAGAC